MTFLADRLSDSAAAPSISVPTQRGRAGRSRASRSQLGGRARGRPPLSALASGIHRNIATSRSSGSRRRSLGGGQRLLRNVGRRRIPVLTPPLQTASPVRVTNELNNRRIPYANDGDDGADGNAAEENGADENSADEDGADEDGAEEDGAEDGGRTLFTHARILLLIETYRQFQRRFQQRHAHAYTIWRAVCLLLY